MIPTELHRAVAGQTTPGPGAVDHARLWAEHGWSLTGRQLALLLALIALFCLGLELAGVS